MWQIDGDEDCVLTWGNLIGRLETKRTNSPCMKSVVTTNYEKSAEVMVPTQLQMSWEGLNFRRSE